MWYIFSSLNKDIIIIISLCGGASCWLEYSGYVLWKPFCLVLFPDKWKTAKWSLGYIGWILRGDVRFLNRCLEFGIMTGFWIKRFRSTWVWFPAGISWEESCWAWRKEIYTASSWEGLNHLWVYLPFAGVLQLSTLCLPCCEVCLAGAEQWSELMFEGTTPIVLELGWLSEGNGFPLCCLREQQL